MAAPMPREAPVTSATLPSSGFSQLTSGGTSAWPMRTTWPDTYADLGESRKLSVEPSCCSAPCST